MTSHKLEAMAAKAAANPDFHTVKEQFRRRDELVKNSAKTQENQGKPTPQGCPICREGHPADRRLSFDGKGVNSCGLYRDRIATVRQGYEHLGPVLAAAPETAAERDKLKAINEELLEALVSVRSLIAEAAATGFNWKDGDWPMRLFKSQATTSKAIAKAEQG